MSEEERLVGPPWGVVDFVMVMLAGLAGAFAAALLVFSTGMSDGAAVALSALGMSGGHAAGIAAVKNRRAAKLTDLGFDVDPADGRYLLLGALLQVVLAVVFSPIAELAGSDGTTQVVADRISAISEIGLRIAIILLVGLAAPIMEELAFRGVLLTVIRRRLTDRSAIAISALVFAVFHWAGVDQGNVAAGLITMVQLFMVGLALGYVTVRRGRLGPAIFLHAGFNMLTLIVLFFAPSALS